MIPLTGQYEEELDWLLAAEPRVVLGECLQPRAVCLPIARQQALILAATAHLHTTAAESEPGAHNKLKQLLQLLSSSTGVSNVVRATADMALLQQQQLQRSHVLTHHRLPLLALGGAPEMPNLLCMGDQHRHSFSWLLAHRSSSSSSNPCCWSNLDAPGHDDKALHTGAADGSRPDAAAQADQDLQQLDPWQPQEQQQAAKRIKLDNDLPLSETTAAAAAGNDLPQQQEAWAAAAALPKVLRQLLAFANDCNTCHLDVQLLCTALEMAAAAGAGDPSNAATSSSSSGHTVALQQLLQQLSVDALQSLLDLLLPSTRMNSSGSASSASSLQRLSATGLAFLLAAGVWPKLQQLDGAAPQALQHALAAAAAAAPDVLAAIVLQPLLVAHGGCLVAVQAQLLVKLMKEEPPLQPRLLQLLLLAAGVQQHSSGGVAVSGSGVSSQCCWCEAHVVLMKALLDCCPQVLAGQLDAVLAALQAAARQPALAKSAAFGQLLMAVLKSFAVVLSQRQVEVLAAAAGATSSFLSKPINAKLQQLLKQHEAAVGM